MTSDLLRIREALEASWDPATAYLGVQVPGNPMLGQCYPTARVLQLLHPQWEIVEGLVWTGSQREKHFWNVLRTATTDVHVDLTWQQFPAGSVVQEWRIRDRDDLDDSAATISRVELLLTRVQTYLDRNTLP